MRFVWNGLAIVVASSSIAVILGSMVKEAAQERLRRVRWAMATDEHGRPK